MTLSPEPLAEDVPANAAVPATNAAMPVAATNARFTLSSLRNPIWICGRPKPSTAPRPIDKTWRP
jgi:hypothetical protein